MQIPIQIHGHKKAETTALIDSGATGNFIHTKAVERYQIPTHPMKKEITVRNVDGTKNKLGTIKDYVNIALDINGHREETQFLVTNIGNEDAILGMPWLKKHNPHINWSKGLLSFAQCPLSCQLNTENRAPIHVQQISKVAGQRQWSRRRIFRTTPGTKLHEDIKAFFSKENPLHDLRR